MTDRMDLTGQRYGRLVVVHEGERNTNRRWVCQCDCGKQTLVAHSNIRNGHTISCGCALYETKNTTHGLSKTKEYKIWINMLRRCDTPSSTAWKDYGAKGTRVCERWKESFVTFLEDMGPLPTPKHSIDRINPKGHYEPNNCRWADIITQARNKSHIKIYEYNGKSQCLSEWAEEYDIDLKQLWYRIHTVKWGMEQALTTPGKKYKSNISPS